MASSTCMVRRSAGTPLAFATNSKYSLGVMSVYSGGCSGR